MRLGVQGQGEFKLRKPQPSALDFRLAFGKIFLLVLSREYGIHYIGMIYIGIL